jgi:nucleotide-binding universal stress UspA family protein
MKPLGIQVTTQVLSGRPDEILVEIAARLDAGLLVVGAVGHRPVERWLLGSCAERTAREASIPVLVVREARPFEEWLENGRPLRVVVGCEDGPSSDGALVWAGSLRDIASIELIVARLVLPGAENQRAGVSGPGMGITLFAETEARLREELRARKASLLGDMVAELRVIPALGRTDQHLVMVADDLGADVVVVGSHQREGFRRWWHGSVSSGVLHGAPMTVAVVPVRSAPPSPPAEPQIEQASSTSP